MSKRMTDHEYLLEAVKTILANYTPNGFAEGEPNYYFSEGVRWICNRILDGWFIEEGKRIVEKRNRERINKAI